MVKNSLVDKTEIKIFVHLNLNYLFQIILKSLKIFNKYIFKYYFNISKTLLQLNNLHNYILENIFFIKNI